MKHEAWQKLETEILLRATAAKEELFQNLVSLIRIDSQNFRTDGREHACAEYMAKLYNDLYLETELYFPDSLPGMTDHPDYLPGRNTHARPNVGAVWAVQDKSGHNPVMLAAHTDTMPVGDIASWQYDPFAGTIADGKIYGLGSGDNKSGLAAAWFAVKIIKESGIKLLKPVVLTAYCDEEYGGGNGALSACLKYPCETYVNLDGGNFELWTIAPGGCAYEIELVKTVATDSLLDIYDAGSLLLDELKQFAARRKMELNQILFYKNSDMARSAFRLVRYSCPETSLNKLNLEFVFYTDKSKEQIETELHLLIEKIKPFWQEKQISSAGFAATTRFFHYCRTDKSNGAAELMRQSAERATGRPVAERGSCLTDLSLFLKYGSPYSFNFGILRDFALPGGAHQPDEYVDCQQLLHYAQSLILFLLRYCGVDGERGGEDEKDRL